MIYIKQSLALILPEKKAPSVMAGLIWQPEIPPMVYAIATTDKPKAKAVPITVPALATSAQFDEQFRLTTTPQPITTSTMVPIISAKYFFIFLLFEM